MRQIGAQRRGDLGEILVRQQTGAFGVREPEGDLARRQPRVDRDRDEPTPQNRKQGFEIAVAIQRKDADAIASRKSQIREGAGELGYPFA